MYSYFLQTYIIWKFQLLQIGTCDSDNDRVDWMESTGRWLQGTSTWSLQDVQLYLHTYLSISTLITI